MKNKLDKKNDSVIKNIYWKLKIKKTAPNCVQKNIKKAASTALRVLAYWYKIKKEGNRKAS